MSNRVFVSMIIFILFCKHFTPNASCQIITQVENALFKIICVIYFDQKPKASMKSFT